MKGYSVKYTFKGGKKHSSYEYQRFFRAIYGYTQVVRKRNGKEYKYMREGVLTRFPYIRIGRCHVIIPEEALGPLVEFFKTAKNPAHKFQYLGEWKVSYFLEEITVKPEQARDAVLSALDRILVGGASLSSILRDVNSYGNDVLASAYAAGASTFRTRWFKELLSLGMIPQDIVRGYQVLERLFG